MKLDTGSVVTFKVNAEVWHQNFRSEGIPANIEQINAVAIVNINSRRFTSTAQQD
jgi:hypothetical protein